MRTLGVRCLLMGVSLLIGAAVFNKLEARDEGEVSVWELKVQRKKVGKLYLKLFFFV